jgi:hypothetical protein
MSDDFYQFLFGGPIGIVFYFDAAGIKMDLGIGYAFCLIQVRFDVVYA